MRKNRNPAKPFSLKWSRDNKKLAKTTGLGVYNIVGFGIPADMNFVDANWNHLNTCPGALACRAVCFAKQGAYNWKTVRAARIHNLEHTLLDSFVPMAIADLARMRKVNTVRIHDSGDFYNQEYYNKWCSIARTLPHITFYAYTKTVNMDLWANKPDNLQITQSLGGKHDNLVNLNRPHSRIFATHDDRIAAGYENGESSDALAIEGVVQIGLVYHGVRKLTESQKRFFK